MLLALALLGCRSEQDIVMAPPVAVTIDSPTYGAFLGDGNIEVRGRVTPTTSVVKVEGEPVAVDVEGRFTASIPFDDRFRTIDVEGISGGTYVHERVPVFDGHDPLATWPDAITLRVTPSGLNHIGETVGAMVDSTGWDQQLAAGLPTIDTGLFTLTPTGITHDPTVVMLTGVEGGLDTALSFRNLTLNYDATVVIFDIPFTSPVSIGFGEIAIGALAVPEVDADGMLSLQLTSSTIRLDDPQFTIAGFDGAILEWIVEQVLDLVVEPLGQLLLDVVMGAFGTIPLGGPFVFATDLVGMPIEVRLTEVYGDPAGLGAGLGVGLGEPAPIGELSIPAPGADAAPIHLALGLHEGLFQAMLASGITDMLTQEITLPGAIGEIVGTGIRNLPGGETAPAGEGWCLSVAPGALAPEGVSPAQVARLQEGTAPLAVLYLPDLGVDIGIVQGGACTPWLSAAMQTKVGLKVEDGTKIGVDVGFAGGSVLYYGTTTTEWNEDEVITGLSTFLSGAMGLLGGMVSFDLADLAGGLGGDTGSTDPFALLGDIQPEIVASTAMRDENGQPIEGLFDVGMQLWPEE